MVSLETTLHQLGSPTNIDQNPNSSELNGGKSIFRPFVVLALPGVNLFRRFSTYRRLPQADPAPKDKLEKELDRLTNKIVSLRQQLLKVYISKILVHFPFFLSPDLSGGARQYPLSGNFLVFTKCILTYLT